MRVSGGIIDNYSGTVDAIGRVEKDNGVYTKFLGDPNIARNVEPGVDFERRGYWRFTLPDFTDKNVLNVALTFKTRNAGCISGPCTPPLTFAVDINRLYVEPTTGTGQAIFDGVGQGLPYLKGSLSDLMLQAQTQYNGVSLGPNAVADINHHEGGWYGFAMKIYRITDSLNRDVYAALDICGQSNCNPLSPAPDPSPMIAQPFLTITYEIATIWPQLHGDARHIGYSTSSAPNTGLSVWRSSLCEGAPQSTCVHAEYSPVAKDGYLYVLVPNFAIGGSHIRALTYSGVVAANRDVPESNNVIGGELSLAVNAEMVVFSAHQFPPPATTILRAFTPASASLNPLWTVTLAGVGEINQVAPTLYGRYVLLGTEGDSTSHYGKLRLYEGRGSTVSLVWTFSPPQGDILSPAAVYKDVILVRASTKLYALPFVDPDGSGSIETSEIRWSLDLGAWSGGKYDRALSSGPAIRGGYVFIGSHTGSVYKIPISGPGAGIPLWSVNVGSQVRGTPGFAPQALTGGVDGVYVWAIPTGSPSSAKVLALSSVDGSVFYQRTYANANVGRSSISLANGKVFSWLGDSLGAWIVVLDNSLATEMYRVQVSSADDGLNGDGNAPAIADGWIFACNGGQQSIPPPDPYGYVVGWNS